MRLHLLLASSLATCCAADKSRAPLQEIFNLHQETCKDRTTLDHDFDQASMLLEKCIKTVDILKGATAESPLDREDFETRNLMLNSYHAWATVHPFADDFKGYFESVRDQQMLGEVALRLGTARKYLQAKLRVKRDDSGLPKKDYCVCHESAYSEVTIASQIDNRHAMVLTMLGAGLVAAKEHKVWLAPDDTTGGLQSNYHVSLGPPCSEPDRAALVGPLRADPSVPRPILFCDRFFSTEIHHTLPTPATSESKIQFLGWKRYSADLILHELIHLMYRDYDFPDAAFYVKGRKEDGHYIPYTARWISALALRPEQFELVPNQQVHPMQQAGSTHMLPEAYQLFCFASWEPRTTWLWAPYDYSKGAKEEDQEWGREQENEDILDKLLEYSKRDFGFPVKADSDEKIPVPADVDISTEGTF